MNFLGRYKLYIGAWSLFILFVLLPPTNVYPKVLFQFWPTLSVSEEFSDNYLETRDNKQEEFITTYGAGFSLGMFEKNLRFYLNYSPEYRDYKELNDRDRLVHPIELGGEWSPTRRTDLAMGIAYTAGNDNYQSESEHNTASFSGITRLARTLALDYSHSYDDAFDRQIRTGNFTDHTVNTTDVELTGQYGVKNIYSAGLRYMVDDYDAVSDDSFTQIEPHARLTHWMTPMSGIATSIAYKDKDFDDQGGDEQTLSADIRYIRVLSRNFDVYAKYRQSYADTDAYEHHIFHPSVGFDWAVDKTSGVSMGAGFLFHDWSNDNDDDTDLFLDLDAYKRFEFSPRMQLAFTASSGYSESNETAASLGYNIHYRAGGRFNYRLTRQLSSNLFTAYQVTDYQETAQDRKDEEIIAGASLSWLPVKWLQFNLEYRYTDFSTNTTEREDYAQNTALLTVRFFPEKPIRFDSPVSRNTLETFLFD